MTRLVVEKLGKEFMTAVERLTVLEDVSFSLSAGDDLAIVGASGSGKSTLLYILGTLDKPTSGSVMIDGVDPFTLSPVKLAAFRNKSIGFVFQDHHLLPQLTVAENVLLPAMATGRPTAELVSRAEHLINEVGLAQRNDHTPGQLSGGERQRVAVARALLHSPKLLLADEPTGNLDAVTSERISDLLFDLPKREGATLIVVTHSDVLAARATHCMRIEEQHLKSLK